MTVAYSSHPIDKLKLGRFQFERGQLKLDSAEDEAEFDALLAKQPPHIACRVKKMDVRKAEQLAASFKRSQMIGGIDTTQNSIQAPQPTNSDEGANVDPVNDGGDGEGEDGNDESEAPATPAVPLQFGKRGDE